MIDKPIIEMTDIELADRIRGTVDYLNDLALSALRRELIVAYRIKSPEHGDTLKPPRIIVSVMTEVA